MRFSCRLSLELLLGVFLVHANSTAVNETEEIRAKTSYGSFMEIVTASGKSENFALCLLTITKLQGTADDITEHMKNLTRFEIDGALERKAKLANYFCTNGVSSLLVVIPIIIMIIYFICILFFLGCCVKLILSTDKSRELSKNMKKFMKIKKPESNFNDKTNLLSAYEFEE